MGEKVNVILYDQNRVPFKEGKVAYEKIAEASNIVYNGETYSYQVTSKVMTATFVAVGAPVLLMDKDFE